MGAKGSKDKSGKMKETVATLIEIQSQARVATAKKLEGTTDALVTCGPVVGTVTETSAILLIEVDENVNLTCVASPLSGGAKVTQTLFFIANEPAVFFLEGLKANTEYAIRFSPLAPAQAEELEERGCKVRTMAPPDRLRELNLIALSCDYPSRLPENEENPWGSIASACVSGECHIVLHLGDQVYAVENGCMESAVRAMDLGEHPKSTEPVRRKMEREARAKLKEVYRWTWYRPEIRLALAHSSHLMIWSDNDVSNDFTVHRNEDGSQAYYPRYLKVAMEVYRSYQRQLWDPTTAALGEGEAMHEVEEWHFHQYGPFGIFLIDMRGNRIRSDGCLYEGLPPIMSTRQRTAIQRAFETKGLMCMVLCAEIPFVGESPDGIEKKAEKFEFLRDHWPYSLEELLFLCDLAFDWKAAVPGRQVLMVGGDIHVSVDSVIQDSKTKSSIRHVTTSPVTNEVRKFFPALTGNLGDRYSYVHTPIAGLARTFCKIRMSLNKANMAELESELVCFPAGGGGPMHEPAKPEPTIRRSTRASRVSARLTPKGVPMIDSARRSIVDTKLLVPTAPTPRAPVESAKGGDSREHDSTQSKAKKKKKKLNGSMPISLQ